MELNDRFVAALRERLASDEHWRKVADRVRIHHMPVEQLPADQPYDAIVSGLPLNNFRSTVVRSILAHLQKLAGQGRDAELLRIRRRAEGEGARRAAARSASG